MKENSIEEYVKILEEKMNKELDFFIENASKAEQLTAISMIAMKEPIILLFLSILSDYKRVLKENEELLEVKVSASANNRILELQKENEELKADNYELNNIITDLLENIPIQKIKDKIEEILNNKEYRIVFEGNAEFPDDATIINAQKYIKLEKMQELIEEREEK